MTNFNIKFAVTYQLTVSYFCRCSFERYNIFQMLFGFDPVLVFVAATVVVVFVIVNLLLLLSMCMWLLWLLHQNGALF